MLSTVATRHRGQLEIGRTLLKSIHDDSEPGKPHTVRPFTTNKMRWISMSSLSIRGLESPDWSDRRADEPTHPLGCSLNEMVCEIHGKYAGVTYVID